MLAASNANAWLEEIRVQQNDQQAAQFREDTKQLIQGLDAESLGKVLQQHVAEQTNSSSASKQEAETDYVRQGLRHRLSSNEDTQVKRPRAATGVQGPDFRDQGPDF